MIEKKRIYWTIVSIFLTAFGTYELYQLITMYINDLMATKTSTLPMDAKFLSENLGVTICNQIRPNLTFLNEKNISENIFNYALSFYYNEDDFQLVNDPNELRLELASLLNDNITDKSLKRFFEKFSMKNSATENFDVSLRVKNITYQGSTICHQYAFHNQSDESWVWLQKGITDFKFYENFEDGDSNTRNSYLSIYNHDDLYHPANSESFLPLKFQKHVDYLSKINVQTTKYLRKFNCKPTPSGVIPQISRAKTICLEICAEFFRYKNCSRPSEIFNGIFNEIFKPKPSCDFNDRDMINESEINHSFRQCVIDRRCDEEHFCTEWAFDITFVGINGNKPKILFERNENESSFGSHEVWFYFLANSYLIEEVLIMTVDMLLANIGGLLGLICGFELIMAARFFYDRACILFALLFTANPKR